MTTTQIDHQRTLPDRKQIVCDEHGNFRAWCDKCLIRLSYIAAAVPEPYPHEIGSPRTLQGKCHHCQIAYRWRARKPLPTRLCDAHCPYCKRQLFSTTHLLKKWPWYGLQAKESGLEKAEDA